MIANVVNVKIDALWNKVVGLQENSTEMYKIIDNVMTVIQNTATAVKAINKAIEKKASIK